MEEQQWILTQFLPLYHQNRDHAYQRIINHSVALLSQTNINDLILKTDGTPMDLTTLNQHISTVIQHGIPQQNNMPLSTPVVDVNPIDLQQEQQDMHNKIYNRLKGSVCDDQVEMYHEAQILNHNLQGLGYCLKSMDKNLKNITVVKTTQYFLIGKVLLAMKNIDTNFLIAVKKEVSYSRSYVYFLIDFYKQCTQYPRLKLVRLQISLINKSWSYIKNMMQTDAVFWM